MFLSLPTVYSILSIMLQVIFQRYMLVVVVFFYLLILKLTHPVFFPGLVFSSRNRLGAFCFGQPIFTWILSDISERSNWRAGCQFSIQHQREQQEVQGHRSPWRESSFLLAFSHFLARLQYHMPDLMCWTVFLVYKQVCLFAQPHHPTTKSVRNLFPREACACRATLAA